LTKLFKHTILRKMRKIILLFILVFFISCAPYYRIRFQPFSNLIYSPTWNIDVYSAKKPSREYIEIGRIEATGSDIMRRALLMARKVGGDGLILLQGDKDTGYWNFGQVILPVTTKHLIFIVIKYKD